MLTRRDENFENRKAEDLRANKKWNPETKQYDDYNYSVEEKVNGALKISTVVIKQNQKLQINLLKIVDGINKILEKIGSDYRITFDKPQKDENVKEENK